jgi:hypothetical protein
MYSPRSTVVSSAGAVTGGDDFGPIGLITNARIALPRNVGSCGFTLLRMAGCERRNEITACRSSSLM